MTQFPVVYSPTLGHFTTPRLLHQLHKTSIDLWFLLIQRLYVVLAERNQVSCVAQTHTLSNISIFNLCIRINTFNSFCFMVDSCKIHSLVSHNYHD